MGALRSFLDANIKLSNAFERRLPASLRTDGNTEFLAEVLPRVLQRGAVVWDVGSGSRPFISPAQRQDLNIRVVGTDISPDELSAAPEGSYDEAIVADLCTYIGRAEADFAICQAVLEHVPDNVGALRALSSIVKPGGRILIFAPSRNALFARLNLLLPEGLKRRLLFWFFPHKAEGHDGFRAYYDHCVPRKIEALVKLNGLEIEERRLYWVSSYFKPFFPAYVGWRIYQAIARALLHEQAAETFVYVLRKPELNSG